MRAHISMVVLNSLLAAGAISVIAVYHDTRDSDNVENIMHLIELCGLGGLMLASMCSMVWFICYHCECNFKSDPIQLGEDEIVIRNAAGDTVIIRSVAVSI